MKTKTSLLLAVGLLGLTAATLRAQVAINTSGISADASAILDLNAGNAGVNKGFLAPQVVLTDVTIAAPVVNPATGLIVYSITPPTGGSGSGYYYWNGTSWSIMGSVIFGSGINNYVARWTPNASTLGTGMIQDNGTTVGINSAPLANDMLYVNSTTGTGISGQSNQFFAEGVYGEDDGWIGVEGFSTSAFDVGVWGENDAFGSVGVYGTSNNGYGMYASSNSLFFYGLYATSASNDAVYTSAGFGGVFGNGTQYGVYGEDGVGDIGLLGVNYYGAFEYGAYASGINLGMYAIASAGPGVSANGATDGVDAVGTAGYGVNASGTTAGVNAVGSAGPGVSASGSTDGVDAIGTAGYGVDASGVTAGVYALASAGPGVSANGSTDGVDATGAAGYGVDATGTTAGVYATGSAGPGVYASGSTDGVDGISTAVSGHGVYGEDDNAVGVEGISNSSTGVGVWAVSTDGMPFNATFNVSTATTGGAIYSENYLTGDTDYVNYYNGTDYKILGGGTVSTIVKDAKGEKVVLHAPETPEIYFEDYGEGQLTNGKTHITLDATIAQNVTINDRHPLRAYIQLEGDCNGVYVTNKTASGFDVVELKGGKSNTHFQWHIVCNRADETFANGRVSHNADVRLEKAPAPQFAMANKNANPGSGHLVASEKLAAPEKLVASKKLVALKKPVLPSSLNGENKVKITSPSPLLSNKPGNQKTQDKN